MANDNWQEIEKRAGLKAARALRNALRSEISRAFRNRSGQIRKTNVSARFNRGLLDRLVITSPRYSFPQHYGYHWPDEVVKPHNRRANSVKSHFRGGALGTGKIISSYFRKGSRVFSYRRDIENKPKEHFSAAIIDSNILETLATDLAESRSVKIIDSKFIKNG